MMILECDGSLRTDARTQARGDRSALLRLAGRSRNLIKMRLAWWTRRGDSRA